MPGSGKVKHEVTVFDPRAVFGEGGALASSGAQLTTPHFYFKGGEAPAEMDAMRDTIKAADAYVVVTSEYNHSVPPSLSSMLGHFGGSNYAFKPSAIVTYSPSPWGGMRAAMALRPLLSELGCLPVSKLCGIPNVTNVLNADGTPSGDEPARPLGQLPKMLGQLEWMAVAMANQREKGIPS